MTKKSKDDTVPLHQSQKINPIHNSGEKNILSSVNSVKNKKSIKKPQQLSLIQKVDSLKEKNHKLYKHAEKKIDRMIEIIDEISQKQLALNTGGKKDDSGGGVMIIMGDNNNGSDNKAIELQQGSNNVNQSNHPLEGATQAKPVKNKTSNQQRQLISKTLTYLHNLLTYQKPLSHIKREFQSFYAKLSAFSKQLQSQQPLPEDKKFLIPQDGLNFEQTRLVQQLIKQHYMRTGRFDVAMLFDSYGKQEEMEKNDYEDINNNIPSASNLSNKSSTKRKASGLSKKQDNSIKNKSPQKSIKKRPKVQLIDLEQNFHQCFILRNKLLKRQFQQPINWCVQQRLYETHSNPLQYQLRLTEIKLLIKEEKYNLAYEKIQKDMVKFLDNYEQEINTLVGFLLFSCGWQSQKIFMQGQETQRQQQQQDNDNKKQQQQQPQTQPLHKLLLQRYSKFIITQGQIQHLAQKFTHEYFIHYDISQFDTLEICYKVGKMYQQQYFDCIKMFSQKDRQDFLKHRVHCQFNNNRHQKGQHSIILPFEIPVDKQHLYHSIFVCPVTKQVLSSNDGVEFLSCGHLVSQSAKKNMAEVRRSNHKQKCPVCQKDRASDVIKVSF